MNVPAVHFSLYLSQGSTDPLTFRTLAQKLSVRSLPAGKTVMDQNIGAFHNTHLQLLAQEQPGGHSGVCRRPHSYLRRMMCVMTKAKMKMVRKESDRMNM